MDGVVEVVRLRCRSAMNRSIVDMGGDTRAACVGVGGGGISNASCTSQRDLECIMHVAGNPVSHPHFHTALRNMRLAC